MALFHVKDAQPKVFNAIVAVHGVGNAKPGDILLSIAAEFDKKGAATHERADFVIKSVTYPRVATSDSSLPQVIEVNWSDLQRAKKSLWGLLVHIAKVVLAATSVAIQWGTTSKRELRKSPLLLLPILLEAAIPWSTAIAVYVMFLVTGDSGMNAARILVVTIVGVVLALWAAAGAARWSKPFSIGGYAALILFLILSVTIGLFPDSKDWWLSVVDRLYAYIQVGSGWYLVIAFLYILWDRKRLNNTLWQALARFALCVTGVVVLSLGTRVIWAICASAIAILAHFGVGLQSWKHWEQQYLGNTLIFGRPMATIEFSMYGAMSVIGCLLVLASATYAIFRWHLWSTSSGEIVRFWLKFIIAAIPVLLAFFGAFDMSGPVIRVLSFFLPISRDTVAGTASTINVATLYVTSMTRILPFLIVVVTPAVVMLDIAGDILFYVLRDHPLGIRCEVTRRIVDLIQKLEAQSESGKSILVIAHSQGSVAALDTLNKLPETATSRELITLGSPITSLYTQFLDRPAKRLGTFRWQNCCRPGDYIGSALSPDLHVEEIPYIYAKDPGGHIDYWGDKAILGCVFKDSQPGSR